MLGHGPIEVLFARRDHADQRRPPLRGGARSVPDGARPPGNTRTPVIRPPIWLHLRIGYQSKAGLDVFCGAAIVVVLL